jgi:endonuclease YncB( thermonuclease family)
MMSTAPGWFPDPQGPPGHLRWWDGKAWTEQRIAPPEAPVPAAWSPVDWARRHPLSAVGAAVVILLLLVGAIGSATEESDLTDGAPAAREADLAPEPEAAPKGPEPELEAEPVADPKPRTFLVTRIVDGDTIELGNGATVRLVGIDAPEAGACGSERAADNLARLVLGKQVRLKESDEDRDRYGRLLRYVDIGGRDAGLRLIKNGLAVARYDSRDGYGRHPRQRIYIAADKRAKQVACAPKPQPFVPQQPSGNCAPGYAPCVPSYPPDVDCPDVDGPVAVTGPDPHGLDADGDGVACE